MSVNIYCIVLEGGIEHLLLDFPPKTKCLVKLSSGTGGIINGILLVIKIIQTFTETNE